MNYEDEELVELLLWLVLFSAMNLRSIAKLFSYKKLYLDAPKVMFTVPLEPVQVGAEGVISCKATGNPAPMITLHYTAESGNTNTVFASTINTSILTVGKYDIACNATNPFGSIIKTVTFKVVGKYTQTFTCITISFLPSIFL